MRGLKFAGPNQTKDRISEVIMKRFLCFTLFLCIIFPASAVALDFSKTFLFSGSDLGGTGSATMTIEIYNDTNEVKVLLDNTSPLFVQGSQTSAAGITGFGFDLDGASGTPTWSLKAFDSNTSGASEIQIGGPGSLVADPWELIVEPTGPSQGFSGIVVDYIPNTGSNVKGALYNPAASSGFAAPPNYFTTATLVLDFPDTQPDPVLFEDFENFSPFVRMQNVGGDDPDDGNDEIGDGSLKLTPVPEPSTMIISGLFLLGAGVFVRRKLHRKS
jgi:hypothetical protein